MSELPPTLSIGEVAARSGVATSALRFYEDLGLIASERNAGNQRRYHRSVLRRVALIQAGRAAGIPLRAIGDALAVLPGGRVPGKRDWERLSKSWRADVEARIALLEALRDDLTGCIGCGCLSLRRCRLMNRGDKAADEGAGARYLAEASATPGS
jgi:MerR family transcriptional regulator, redox-sensitive transcriptional activator SoxR